MQTVYLVDFDHTISRQDVWDAIVRHCAPDEWRTMIRLYVEGELTSRQCNQRLAELIPPIEEEMREMILAIGIDPTFHDFLAWLDERQAPIRIVSDGYDYYIDMLLEQEGIRGIPRYCNELNWTDQGAAPVFPFFHPDCERDMAHCKCQRVLEAEGMRRVYIGDGISDYCAARRCEQIYAKHNLLEYCRKEGIAHTPFDDFHDVMRHENAWFAERERTLDAV